MIENCEKRQSSVAFKTIFLAIGLGIGAGTTALSFSTNALAFAQWYLEGRAGVSLPLARDAEAENSGVADQRVRLSPGPSVSGAVGASFGGPRVEVEAFYRQSDADTVGRVSGDGSLSTTAGMINGFYDFELGNPDIKPFVGLGVGFAAVDADGIAPVNGSQIDDRTTGYAYQVMTGVGYDISDTMTVSLHYAFFAVPSLEYEDNAGQQYEMDYMDHTVMLGLRYRFGGVEKPEPRRAGQLALPDQLPQVPVAAPDPNALKPRPRPSLDRQRPPLVTASAGTPELPEAPVLTGPGAPQAIDVFEVFFEWDSVVLDQRAMASLAAAVDVVKAGRISQILITGHTDRSGSEIYNLRLSQVRAEAVRRAMISLGVSADSMLARGVGEGQPKVPTADGALSAQNRRAQIELQAR